MRARPASALVMVAAGLLAACGSSSGAARLPAADADAAARLSALTDLDQRVARVAYRLSVANAELCPTVRRSAGWALHSSRQYSQALRPFAEARFGLRGDLPGVLAAPEGSPAAEAGLATADLILDVNETALATGDGGERASFSGLAANVARLDEALAQGRIHATVERNGRTRTVAVTPRTACGYEVQLDPSDELNARADGRRLFISTALAGFADSDDELAVILGHELAHHVLRHRDWSDLGGLGRSENAEAHSTRPEGDPERQADRVGLYLVARAGYDPAVAAPFWRRFGASNWRVRYPQLAHASAETRARRLEEVNAEIGRLVAAKQPLHP